MGRFVDQVQMLVRGYVRKGGKANRRQQAARMIAFAYFCEAVGVREKGQVGARHVIQYWRQCRHLSVPTLYNHYRALCILWGLADLSGVPPKPKFVRSDSNEGSGNPLGIVEGETIRVTHDVMEIVHHW